MPRELREKNAARQVQLLSGMSYTGALHMARAGLLTPRQPVPDALSLSQQIFEGLILHALVDAFPENSQVPQLFLGIASIRPLPVRPTLHLHPSTQTEVLAALMPRHDADYGGIVGAPGLRLRPSERGLLLAEWAADPANTGVQLSVGAAALAAARQLIADRAGGLRPEDGQQPTNQEYDEIEFRRRDPSFRARSLLLSRVLRRIRVIDLVGRSHGRVNVYHHGYTDIVLEWCCGPDVALIARKVIGTGLIGDARATSKTLADVDDPGSSSRTLELDRGSRVVLRRNQGLHDGYQGFEGEFPASPGSGPRRARR